ncbi:right-handed parallel beta-helix repeat-containing protein [Phycisphaera mikurensis]|uniref:Right handed beta helix domain-containing protein n=1 Tax=Phycisphaera mikurensis (strain NBRC 102666 / KCTC 22515 / FYK2301M01) TaxID=1142394 RepID=I0II90_PHYMF|nr:right-handed parallel beta-helix repeat-containing protein [Phycisphaera mikurensis]MBB6442459.1 hypothetical protein [Phycisphaera mikurensis]BAM04978.1 hypothetical protein PSMK_28190 [Phycisphaera mikurensis NBRC 102666]
MHLSRFCSLGLLAAAASPAAAAGLDDLLQDLASAGAEVSTLPDLGGSEALAEALAGKRRRAVQKVAEGLNAAVYAGGGETLVVLAVAPDAVAGYLLPGGERLAFRSLGGEALQPGGLLDRRVVFATSPRDWDGLQYYTQLSPANPEPVEVTGAAVDESVAFSVVRVSAAGGAGAVATLREGLEAAADRLAAGEHVRVEVSPGLYREGGLSLPGNLGDDAAGTLVIEGVGPGEAVITGADVFSGGWTEVPDHPGVWSKPWPHRFGMGGQPWARWGYLLPAEACRAEVITVDGELYLPVMLEKFAWSDPDGAVPLDGFADGTNQPGRWEPSGVRSPEDLPEGAYGVVEAEGTVYLRPPAGTDLNAAAVESGVRPRLLSLLDRRDTVLRNLTFRHAAHHVGGAPDGSRDRAVELGGRNLVVENCRFEENAAFGLALGRAVADTTIRGSAFNANGWKGLGGGFLPENVLFDGNESSSNNWRGHMGGEHSWDAAAVKVFGVNSARGIAIRGHRSFANLTHGFWLDQSFVPYAPVEISDGRFVDNRFGAELYLEKLTGPVEIERNLVDNASGLYGVNGTSWNLHFRGNVLAASGDRTVFFLHRRGNESDYANASRDWIVADNRIEAATPDASVYLQGSTPGQYAEFVATYRGSGNLYVRPGGSRPFVGTDGRPIDLHGWRALTGQEEGSAAVAPGEGPAARIELSAEDRRRLAAANARTDRFLAIAAAVEASSGPPFERITRAVGNNVQPVSLAGRANRALLGGDAWIGGGMQLNQLGGGRSVFAGVPFDVADPAGGAEVAIALRSEKLPGVARAVEVPIGGRVEAVYVLHGAGWVDDDPAPVGAYELIYDDVDEDAAGLVIGSGGPGGPAANTEPLVGDWYGSFQPFDGRKVRHARLPANEAGVAANLYIVEIVNPRPDRAVRSLRLRSFEGRDPTLVVLGVTALRR